MARKISEKLIDRMTHGDLVPLLNYLKTELKSLRLEVRKDSKAFVYYKKCLILELGLNSYKIHSNYFQDKLAPTDIAQKVINDPEQYFKEIKPIIDIWLKGNKKEEFETQQNIARDNQEKNDKYIILDMEYNFSQNEIKANNRWKQAGFDLLGIERQTGKIVFFELKKGLNALRGNAGIKNHIKDFEKILHGSNSDLFRNNLLVDIKNIVSDKKKLGFIDNFDLPDSFAADDVDFIFVFEPMDCNKDEYSKIFHEEHNKYKQENHEATQREYKTIYVSENNFKLL